VLAYFNVLGEVEAVRERDVYLFLAFNLKFILGNFGVLVLLVHDLLLDLLEIRVDPTLLAGDHIVGVGALGDSFVADAALVVAATLPRVSVLAGRVKSVHYRDLVWKQFTLLAIEDLVEVVIARNNIDTSCTNRRRC